MSEQAAAKVTGAHLARTAYLYVRQSTLRQVLTNTESATRQYGLRQKASRWAGPPRRSSPSTPTRASPAPAPPTGTAFSGWSPR